MTVSRSATTIYFSGAQKSPGAYYIKEKLARHTPYMNTLKTQRGGIILNLIVRI
jgi:hypothetical protein